MKITTRQLREIIKEEVERMIVETQQTEISTNSREFEVHDVLKDVNLEKVCDLASRLERTCQDLNPEVRDMTEDLSLALEYLRLHFKLVPTRTP